jgi:hypothetical protein
MWNSTLRHLEKVVMIDHMWKEVVRWWSNAHSHSSSMCSHVLLSNCANEKRRRFSPFSLLSYNWLCLVWKKRDPLANIPVSAEFHVITQYTSLMFCFLFTFEIMSYKWNIYDLRQLRGGNFDQCARMRSWPTLHCELFEYLYSFVAENNSLNELQF